MPVFDGIKKALGLVQASARVLKHSLKPIPGGLHLAFHLILVAHHPDCME